MNIIGIITAVLAIASDKITQYGHNILPIGILAGILIVLVLLHAVG